MTNINYAREGRKKIQGGRKPNETRERKYARERNSNEIVSRIVNH